jgi:uracil-DNA glycosylase
MTIKALIVAEAYGDREERYQHHLVGPTGRELAVMMKAAGMIPEGPPEHATESQMIEFWRMAKTDFGIVATNVFNLRPPDNNLDAFFTTKTLGLTTYPPYLRGKYLRPEYAHHVEKLWHLISDLRPNLLICLGNAALWAVLRRTGISNLRGTTSLCPDLQIKTLATFHPASLFKGASSWANRPIIIGDLTKAAREMETPDISRTKRWFLVSPTLAEIARWFEVPATHYAVDIETGRAIYTKLELKTFSPQMHAILNRQISMIGFARNKTNAICIPFMTRHSPDLNYWATEAEEVKALHLIQKALAKPIPKIFQNGIFDIPFLWSYGLRPRHCTEDSMLLHHSIYAEMPKGLGFLGATYADAPSWKQAYGHGEANLKKDE